MTHPLTHQDWLRKAETLAIEGRLFIEGRYVPALDGGHFDCVNPTTGALLVMAAEGRSWGSKGCFALALLAAAVSLGVILYAASFLERKLGQRRLAVLRRLTGLILCSMAAQMIMAGIAAMLHPAAVQP